VIHPYNAFVKYVEQLESTNLHKEITERVSGSDVVLLAPKYYSTTRGLADSKTPGYGSAFHGAHRLVKHMQGLPGLILVQMSDAPVVQGTTTVKVSDGSSETTEGTESRAIAIVTAVMRTSYGPAAVSLCAIKFTEVFHPSQPDGFIFVYKVSAMLMMNEAEVQLEIVDRKHYETDQSFSQFNPTSPEGYPASSEEEVQRVLINAAAALEFVERSPHVSALRETPAHAAKAAERAKRSGKALRWDDRPRIVVIDPEEAHELYAKRESQGGHHA
jgi:hypothetical protein